MVQKYYKSRQILRAKNGPKMESNIFSHSRWKNICWIGIGTDLNKNGRVLDLEISRLGASWRPLGPISIFFWRSWGASWARPGAVRVPPEASPERFGGYFLVLFVMMIIYIIEGVFLKNRRFMRVKRTILKVHLLALAILDPILSTCSSFEHQYTSQSIQLPLGNAGRHMSDPLPDAFFSPRTPPRSGF